MSILLQVEDPIAVIEAFPLSLPILPVRRWKRFSVDLSFKAFFMKEGMPMTIYGRGSDVSEGGMAAYIASDLPIGCVIEVELTLPYMEELKPLSIKATVRNRTGYRYGLEYAALQDVDRDILLRSMRALALTQ